MSHLASCSLQAAVYSYPPYTNTNPLLGCAKEQFSHRPVWNSHISCVFVVSVSDLVVRRSTASYRSDGRQQASGFEISENQSTARSPLLDHHAVILKLSVLPTQCIPQHSNRLGFVVETECLFTVQYELRFRNVFSWTGLQEWQYHVKQALRLISVWSVSTFRACYDF